LLRKKLNAEQSERLATTLSSGIFTHDYPIMVDEARDLGLPVSTDMPTLVYDIMSLYPQTAQKRPSVEFIPTPRSRSPEGTGNKK